MGSMWDNLKPALLMVIVQIAYSACNIFYKLAIYDGMSTIVLTAYRLAFASVTIIPIALLLERKKRPKMSWRVIWLHLLTGLIVSIFQNLFYGALVLTSATIVSAIFNLIPTITFILAVSFGLEKLNWGATSGKAKVLGTILGLGGALLLTFYKGVEFDFWPFQVNLLNPEGNQSGQVFDTNTELLGALCAVISCIAFSFWLIVQAKISEVYPCPISSSGMLSVFGTILCVILGFIVERDLNQWKLGWDIRLLTAAFSGILPSGIMIIVMAWVIQIKGPLFTSSFNPLMLLFVAVVASMVLDEKLNLGSILGGVLIVCGLYTVLWGKGREASQKKTEILEPWEIAGDYNSDSQATRPLLNP